MPIRRWSLTQWTSMVHSWEMKEIFSEYLPKARWCIKLICIANPILSTQRLSKDNITLPSEKERTSVRFLVGVAVRTTPKRDEERQPPSRSCWRYLVIHAEGTIQGGGRTSDLHPEGVLAVPGHLGLIHKEAIEVEYVNVISQGKWVNWNMRTTVECWELAF